MTGTNAESFSAPSFMTPFSLARRSRLIHLCNRFAFTPCESARLAIDTPGCKHASTSRLFACGSNIRLPSRFPLIIGSPSHTDSSMSYGVHCQLGGHTYSASTLQCARCIKLSAYVEGVNLYNVSLYGAQYIHLRYGLIRPSPWLHRVRRLPRRKVWFCAGG